MSSLQGCVKSGLHNLDITRAPRFKYGCTVGISLLKQVRQATRPYTTYHYYACRKIPVCGEATSTTMGSRKRFIENKSAGENSKRTDKNDQSPVILGTLTSSYFHASIRKESWGIPKLPEDW